MRTVYHADFENCYEATCVRAFVLVIIVLEILYAPPNSRLIKMCIL